MAFNIETTKKITAGTTAKTVPVASKTFLISNTSETATVYFRNNSDGVACGAGNGFPVLPKQTLPFTLCAPTISIYATAEADVFLLYGEEFK